MPSNFRGADNFDTKTFESAEQAITSAGALVLPHLLGRKPRFIQAKLICKTAEDNWVPGDEIYTSIAEHSSAAVDGRGCAIVADNTNLYIRYGSHVNVFLSMNKTLGTSAGFTNANFRLVVIAW